MSVTLAYVMAPLCSWGVWEFGSLLGRMLRERQFEGSDGEIIKADEQPGKFRLNVYLAAAIVLATIACAVQAWMVIARHWL